MRELATDLSIVGMYRVCDEVVRVKRGIAPYLVDSWKRHPCWMNNPRALNNESDAPFARSAR